MLRDIGIKQDLQAYTQLWASILKAHDFKVTERVKVSGDMKTRFVDPKAEDFIYTTTYNFNKNKDAFQRRLKRAYDVGVQGYTNENLTDEEKQEKVAQLHNSMMAKQADELRNLQRNYGTSPSFVANAIVRSGYTERAMDVRDLDVANIYAAALKYNSQRHKFDRIVYVGENGNSLVQTYGPLSSD